MAPTLVADAEALAWRRPARARHAGRGCWRTPRSSSVEGAFDFITDAAAATAAALPSARLEVMPGEGHQWRPADLADAIASAVLPR